MTRDIDQSIKHLEGRMDVLEDIEKPTYSDEYELSVVYFQLSVLYRTEGKTELADQYKGFCEAQLKEVRKMTDNDPTFLTESRKLHEYFGEALPADLEAAIKEHEMKADEAKSKKGTLSRLLGALVDSSEDGYKINSETFGDAFVKLDEIKNALALREKKQALALEAHNYDLSRAVERALFNALYIASLDDHELECGVEGDYLRKILSPEEFADKKTVMRKILSGEIDFNDMPDEYKQFDFGDGIEVNPAFTEQMRMDAKKLDYLEARIAETEKEDVRIEMERKVGKLRRIASETLSGNYKDGKVEYVDASIKKAENEKQREALKLLRAKILNSLIIREMMLDNPDVLVATGVGEQVSGPTDIGTSYDRKMFYFKNAATRALKHYLPQLEHRMKGATEDVESGWDYLREKIPIFGELENLGTLEMAKALRGLGYEGMRDAVRGLINTSDGNIKVEDTGFMGTVRRAINGVKKLGYDIEGKVSK